MVESITHSDIGIKELKRNTHKSLAHRCHLLMFHKCSGPNSVRKSDKWLLGQQPALTGHLPDTLLTLAFHLGHFKDTDITLSLHPCSHWRLTSTLRSLLGYFIQQCVLRILRGKLANCDPGKLVNCDPASSTKLCLIGQVFIPMVLISIYHHKIVTYRGMCILEATPLQVDTSDRDHRPLRHMP